MRTFLIPDTSLQVSEISLGTGPFGGDLDKPSSYAILDAYVAQGGNLIDTAHVYSDWIPGEKSRSEKLIGAWMNERHNRQEIVISTKGAHPLLQSMRVSRLSPEEIISDLDESLTFLQIDTIDLYWLHRDDVSRPVAEILETLNAQVQAGKIRYFGASNWSAARLEEAQEYAHQNGMRAFCADQVFWNAAVVDVARIPDPTMQVMDDELYRFHQTTKMAAFAYTSQANGLFARLERGAYEALSATARGFYPETPNRTRLERIRAIAQETGKTTNQVVLGYLLCQPFVTIPIIGPKNLPQLHDSLSAAGTSLSPEQIALLSQQPES